MSNDRIAFFHIPKCMGTSINEIFKLTYGSDKVLSPATVYDYMHTPYTDLLKYKVFSGHITKDCLTILPENLKLITILRNPGRRLLSLYSYYQNIPTEFVNLIPSAKAATTLDFHDWLDSGIPQVIVETSNSMIRQFVPERFFSDVYPACPENILKAANSFIEAFKFVGFSELPDLVLQYLTCNLNISINNLPNFNTSGSEKINFDKKRLQDFLQINSDLDIQFITKSRAIMTIQNYYPNKTILEKDRMIFEFIN